MFDKIHSQGTDLIGPNITRPVIALAVHQGFSIRYLLQTEIVRTLQAKECELVILAQDDPAYLASKFGEKTFKYATVPWEVGRNFKNHSRIERVLNFIRQYTNRGSVKVSEHHYRIAVSNGKLFNQNIFWWLRHGAVRVAILAARRSLLLRHLLTWCLGHYYPAEYSNALTELKPDVIVTTSLGTFDYDQYVMRAAKHMKIPVISVVLSWDNTTCRGYPGTSSWQVIAWTNEMKRELIDHNDVAEDAISVCGIAHFDPYFIPDLDFDRSSVLDGLGVDPRKRIVLIATKSPNTYAFNPNLAAILGRAVAEGRLPADVQIVLRIHPLYYRYRDGVLLFEDALEACRKVADDWPAVVINEPEMQSKKVNYDMQEAEMNYVSRLLRSTDVLVNIYSTMNIEAAIFDVPLVNTRIEEAELLYDADMDARFDIEIDHNSDHNLRIVNSGGTRVVNNGEELVAAVAAYLEDPSLDRKGRQRIVEQEVGPNRGNAGSAIGARIYELAQQAIDRGSAL